eukprot:169_1
MQQQVTGSQAPNSKEATEGQPPQTPPSGQQQQNLVSKEESKRESMVELVKQKLETSAVDEEKSTETPPVKTAEETQILSAGGVAASEWKPKSAQPKAATAISEA